MADCCSASVVSDGTVKTSGGEFPRLAVEAADLNRDVRNLNVEAPNRTDEPSNLKRVVLNLAVEAQNVSVDLPNLIVEVPNLNFDAQRLKRHVINLIIYSQLATFSLFLTVSSTKPLPE